MSLTGNKWVALTLALAMVFCVCMGHSQRTSGVARELQTDEQRELGELRARHNNRLLAVPYSLARFFQSGSRAAPAFGSIASSSPVVVEQQQQQQQRHIAGYKRSSSALDALTGVTLGKRSTNPLEFVNFEPIFGRQSFARGPPRVYDLRWAPIDSIESPSSSSQLGADY